MLTDEDHFVRSEALRALGDNPSPQAKRAVRELLLDRSAVLNDAAGHLLQAFAEGPSETGLANVPLEGQGGAGFAQEVDR